MPPSTPHRCRPPGTPRGQGQLPPTRVTDLLCVPPNMVLSPLRPQVHSPRSCTRAQLCFAPGRELHLLPTPLPGRCPRCLADAHPADAPTAAPPSTGPGSGARATPTSRFLCWEQPRGASPLQESPRQDGVENAGHWSKPVNGSSSRSCAVRHGGSWPRVDGSTSPASLSAQMCKSSRPQQWLLDWHLSSTSPTRLWTP